jgi:hypothetical protein
MAHFDFLDDTIHTSIAEQVRESKLLPSVRLNGRERNKEEAYRGGEVRLAESISLWHLPESELLTKGRLKGRAVPMNRWMHQIDLVPSKRLRTHLLAAAITESRDAAPTQRLVSIEDAQSRDSIAHRMRTASAWIDKHVVDDDPVVRYLGILSRLIYVFWLESSDMDRILVISKQRFRRKVHYKTLYDIEDLCALIQAR